jgi:hypothetical protein
VLPEAGHAKSRAARGCARARCGPARAGGEATRSEPRWRLRRSTSTACKPMCSLVPPPARRPPPGSLAIGALARRPVDLAAWRRTRSAVSLHRRALRIFPCLVNRDRWILTSAGGSCCPGGSQATWAESSPDLQSAERRRRRGARHAAHARPQRARPSLTPCDGRSVVCR